MTRLSLAIPSKGRLKEKSEEWLASAGFPVTQIGGERGYQAEIEGLGDVEMRLLSAREIAQGLVDGSLHAGVTGEDLLHDLAPVGESDFDVVKRLGFGGADVIVAVPQAWVDVDTMSDLEAAGAAFRKAHHRRLRVATKYMRPDPPLLCGPVCRRIPPRGKRRGDGGGPNDRVSRCDRRYHLHGRDAEGQRAENPVGRADPEE